MRLFCLIMKSIFLDVVFKNCKNCKASILNYLIKQFIGSLISYDLNNICSFNFIFLNMQDLYL